MSSERGPLISSRVLSRPKSALYRIDCGEQFPRRKVRVARSSSIYEIGLILEVKGARAPKS